MRLMSPSEEIAAAFGSTVSITSILNSGIMKNPSCQDIVRHGSPFRQGGCQSSTALWGRWAQPRCLRLSKQSSAQVLLSWGVPLFLLGSPPYFEIPQLDQLSSLSLFPWFCLLLSSCIDPRHQQWGPSLQATQSGPDPRPTHHCVLPLANARTLCRLIASSRNPATFSLSSCRLKKKHVYVPHKKENKTSAKNSFWIYLVYEGVVHKFACEVFGGVSWKCWHEVIQLQYNHTDERIAIFFSFFLTSCLMWQKNNYNIRQCREKYDLTVND